MPVSLVSQQEVAERSKLLAEFEGRVALALAVGDESLEAPTMDLAMLVILARRALTTRAIPD